MSERYVIPKEHRTQTLFIGGCHTKAEIREGILRLLDSAELGCVPLRHITCRFGGNAKKLGLKIGDIVNELENDGLLGVKRVDLLSRTFIYRSESWADIVQGELDGTLDWSQYAKALADFK